MAQGKFSEQRADQNQSQQGRLTRTDRKKFAEKERIAKYNYEQWRQEAERLRSEVFVDKQVEEKYYIEVPKRYLDRYGNPTSQWLRISENAKKTILRNTSSRNKVKIEKTRQVNDPFTFEEYKQEYQNLDPNVQQFFASPQEITAEQERKKQIERDYLQKKIDRANENLQRARDNLQREKDKWNNLSSEKRRRYRDNYYRRFDEYEYDINEYSDQIKEANRNAGKIEEGATGSDIWNYAEDKARYERDRDENRDKVRDKFKQDIKTGDLDKDLVKLGLITREGSSQKDKIKYSDYTSAVKDYNKNVTYMQGLQRWSEKVGFENLPDWTKQKLNPQAIQWQKDNPSEKLIFDKKGNVVGVRSGTFGGKTYQVEEYDKKVKEYQEYANKLNIDSEKHDQSIAHAQAKLKEIQFGEDVSFDVKKQNIFGKAWTGIKSLYYASPFGTAFSGISESEQEKFTGLREQRVLESVGLQRNDKSNNLEFSDTKLSVLDIVMPLRKFGTIPLDQSWDAIQYQRELDAEQKEATKLITQLEQVSEGSSDEMKPYIMTEGLKVIESKGVEMKEIRIPDVDNIDKYGNVPTQSTIVITDPSFDRRVSQNILEWESELKKDGSINKSFLEQLKPTSFRKALLETRIFSSKALETYGLMKGFQFAIGGIATSYKALGLPSVKFYKTIQLSEGSMRVPRNFGGARTVLGVGITGIYGFGKYKQYQSYSTISQGGSSLFALETLGELTGIESATHIGQRTFNKAYNRIKNWKLETINQPDFSQKGFMRENKLLGGKEHVYMENYQGFKLSKPKSWLQTAQGYKKGQFVARQYKLIPDEVLAYYKYGGDVQVYDKSGQLTKIFKGNIVGIRGDYGVLEYGRSVTQGSQGSPRIISSQPFPYDAKNTHLKWFLKQNIAEYGLPQKFKLPINLKDYKAFGYSATGSGWTGTQFDPNKIMYVDQGIIKAIETKGAYQFVSGRGVSIGFSRIFSGGGYEQGVGKTATDPVIYADYFKNVKINPALREVKGVDLAGREIKAYIYSSNTGQAGTLNIPLYKREVEGTVEIANRIPIRQKYAIKLEGWKVPIVEQVFGTKAGLSSKELKAIVKSMGSISEISGIASSSLPPVSSSFPAMFSVVSYPKPSRSITSSTFSFSSVTSMSKLKSEISRVSEISSPKSTPSRNYNIPISEIISDISKSPPITPTIKTPPYKPIPKILFFSDEKLKEKIKKKAKKKTPETFALLPDFTTRAIGLSPKEVGSVEGAMKEIKKIQTGFGIRRGVKLKQSPQINEKKLMRGIAL
jgi:hypothetical protein